MKEEECVVGGTAAFYGHFPLLHDSLPSLLDISLSLCCAALPLLIKVGKEHRGSMQGSDLYSVDALLQGLLIDRGEWGVEVYYNIVRLALSFRAHRPISLSLGAFPSPSPFHPFRFHRAVQQSFFPSRGL